MNKNLFFLCSATGILILSIICVFTGPSINLYINKILGRNIATINVQILEDDYNYKLDNNFYNSLEAQKNKIKK